MTNGQKLLIDASRAWAASREGPTKHVQEYVKTKNVQGVHVLIGIFMETFFSTSSIAGMRRKPRSPTRALLVAAVAQDPAAVAFENQYNVKPKLNKLDLWTNYTHMQQARHHDPKSFMAWIPPFHKFYCTNGQAYLAPDVDASKYREIPQLTFDEFFKQHSPESLSTAAWGAGSKVSAQ
ncbi:Short-chain dehydrogenase/reductase SDR [Penicillium fimorum]|uniref:Short-chain dehydrogenase/reductase SDR n=1 Tax=Penicillium fimorum TaxID=1882269 RepID=A0A9W9XWM8_9EURO|nr:Short-chain dehydrogenase/reductase SDR [Penicillium fimorum]